jgi:glycosyltransferase involved in cell wall biosynthesis
MEYSTLESLAFGKAVLASDVGGNLSLIEDRISGCLFSAGKSADLASKLSELYAQPELCTALGKKALEMVNIRFSPPKYYSQVLKIYREAKG